MSWGGRTFKFMATRGGSRGGEKSGEAVTERARSERRALSAEQRGRRPGMGDREPSRRRSAWWGGAGVSWGLNDKWENKSQI